MLCVFIIPGEVGFLAEDRRINVAVTRARRHLTVVCDSQTVRNHDFLKSLVDYMTEHGEMRTAFEYLEDVVPQNYTREGPKEGSKQAPSVRQKSKGEPGKGKEMRGEAGRKAESGGKPKGKDSQGKGPGSKPLSGPGRPGDGNQNDDQEQKQKKQEEIRQQIQNFQQDASQMELCFPVTLNSHERLLVHQISEELGLKHESQGEGKNRHITVSKPSTKLQEPQEPSSVGNEELKPQLGQGETKAEEASVTHPGHQGAAAGAGVDLKSLHLERMRREQQKREEKARLSQQQQQQRGEAAAAAGKSQQGKKGRGTAKGEPQNI